MTLQPGDVYWLQLPVTDGMEPRIPHPHVVIEISPDEHNSTVDMCALTTNTKKISVPGNILLEPGEADLPKQSVVEVSKVATVEITLLGDYIGRLSEGRVQQILANLRFIRRSFLDR